MNTKASLIYRYSKIYKQAYYILRVGKIIFLFNFFIFMKLHPSLLKHSYNFRNVRIKNRLPYINENMHIS
jgi:hypothetical protein